MTGQVINNATQGPLEGAEVTITDASGTQIKDITDASGNFSIDAAVGEGRLTSIIFNSLTLNIGEITFNVVAGTVNIGIVGVDRTN